MKKIVMIDARVVETKHGHGIARYTLELIKNLSSLEIKDLNFQILVSSKSPLSTLNLPTNFRLIPTRCKWISLIGQIELSMQIRKHKPDVFHSPSFIVPISSNCPLIATIHDLNHVALSDNYSLFHRFYYGIFLKMKLSKAKKVLTVSEFSKQEILKYFKLPGSKVEVIYNGIGSEFLPSTELASSDLENLRNYYELPREPFILSLGNRKPHKNMRHLMEAYCSRDFEQPLVLLTDFQSELLEIAEAHKKKHKIYFLRFVKDEHLPQIYRMAKIFVFPSIYEGFGFPPIEAACVGTPVVTTTSTSLPEVLGSHAVYAQNGSAEELADALQVALQKNRAPEAHFLLSKKFNWRKAAEETAQIYRA